MQFKFTKTGDVKPGHHCEDCHYRKMYSGGDWSSQMCGHPKAPDGYDNLLTGNVTAFASTLQATPKWCPRVSVQAAIKLGK